ncbi:phage tail protein [Pseudomonas protegens]|uniref:Phage tail protein n=1 Tax=Pseudomonas protegens TaxID=380021 RepID=A0A7G8YQ87_9PSED|nr:phage tail protein [Pseudomonas protegens]QNH77835.1 phage tail protein [Pseudomonas protegens]QNL07031.1 phage tail protein [Pseudomonas protegens]
MFAILGEIEFTVAGGISGMEQRGSADWAEHSRIQGKPLLEWIGEGLEECNLTIELHPVLGDPEARLRALRLAKKKHEPLALVMGSGEYLGPYVIVDLNNVIRRATAVGQIKSASVQVSLKEYTGAFTRKALRPGLLDPAVSGTSAAVTGSPGLISRMLPSPSTTQLVIGHAKTAGNVLKAGQNLYETVKSGNASMILGQVPQLLGVTARAIEPLQGLKDAAGLLDDGSDLSRLGEDVLSSVMGARSSLDPVDLGNIVDRFATSRESLGQALTKMDGASTRLSGLAAQVLTRKA